jgi:hypothetical protein
VDEQPRFGDESQPAGFKTACDGSGGLVRVTLAGGPHDGRSLYIDELDLPRVIYSSGEGRRFEWWSERIQPQMAKLAIATDPEAPPMRYRLRIAEDTREPVFQAEVASTA